MSEQQNRQVLINKHLTNARVELIEAQQQLGFIDPLFQELDRQIDFTEKYLNRAKNNDI